MLMVRLWEQGLEGEVRRPQPGKECYRGRKETGEDTCVPPGLVPGRQPHAHLFSSSWPPPSLNAYHESCLCHSGSLWSYNTLQVTELLSVACVPKQPPAEVLNFEFLRHY